MITTELTSARKFQTDLLLINATLTIGSLQDLGIKNVYSCHKGVPSNLFQGFVSFSFGCKFTVMYINSNMNSPL